MGMMKDFKEFALKGNVMDLAVAVVIAVLMIELRHVHSVAAPSYRLVFRTLSDPRSPPR